MRRRRTLKKYQVAGTVDLQQNILALMGTGQQPPPPPPPGVNPYAVLPGQDPFKTVQPTADQSYANYQKSALSGVIKNDPEYVSSKESALSHATDPQYAQAFDSSILRQMKRDNDPNYSKYKTWYRGQHPFPSAEIAAGLDMAKTALTGISQKVNQRKQDEYKWRNLNNPYLGIQPFNMGRSDNVAYGNQVFQHGGQLPQYQLAGRFFQPQTQYQANDSNTGINLRARQIAAQQQARTEAIFAKQHQRNLARTQNGQPVMPNPNAPRGSVARAKADDITQKSQKERMDIANWAKQDQMYTPSAGTLALKAGIAGSTLTPVSPLTTPASIAGDLYTGTRFLLDGQWDNAKADFGWAAAGIIPGTKAAKSLRELSELSNLGSRAFRAAETAHGVNAAGWAGKYALDASNPSTFRPQLAYGGNISPEKAREMLHNPPHGIPLTDKQRKYFGYLSSKMQGGGMYDFIFNDDDEEEKSTPKNNTAPDQTEVQEQMQAEQIKEQRRQQRLQNRTNAANFFNNFNYNEGEDEEPTTGGAAVPGMSVPGAERAPINAKPINVNTAAKEAYNHYTSKGLPSHVAAGIVGNLMQESGLNTGASGDAGKAKGIAQWHPDRFKKLQQWARSSGRDPFDLKTQLDYILVENDPTAGNFLQEMHKSGSAEKAAEIFSRKYERPGTPHMSNRMGYAKSLVKGQVGGSFNTTYANYLDLLGQGYKVKIIED